jgi:methionyl-tRNA formyltransferase
MNIIISKNNAWSKELFDSVKDASEDFIWLTECNHAVLEKYSINYIFFFHWSEIVPEVIFNQYKCVVIHTANLPQGRGGSPLQNQILDGILNSRVNLLQMTAVVDGGPIYCSKEITLQGSLTDIWMGIARTAAGLIMTCVQENPTPIEQTGTPHIYKRKTNNEIQLDETRGISYVYDQIRMLDADGYPSAYIELNGFRFEFSRAKIANEEIIADVKIIRKK